MPFEFNCPQGHLLSAEPNQVGQMVQCPLCQSQFAIPAPAVAPPAAKPPPAAAPPPAPPTPPPPPAASPPLQNIGPGATDAGLGIGDDVGFDPLAGIDAGNEGADDDSGGGFGDVDVYSIPCPNGHVLETPAEMLGQHAMCPHCEAQFELREKDSLEYKERRRREIERQDAIVGEKWLKRAIWIAVAVGLGLMILVIINLASG